MSHILALTAGILMHSLFSARRVSVQPAAPGLPPPEAPGLPPAKAPAKPLVDPLQGVQLGARGMRECETSAGPPCDVARIAPTVLAPDVLQLIGGCVPFPSPTTHATLLQCSRHADVIRFTHSEPSWD
jgi:hypothetical protein